MESHKTPEVKNMNKKLLIGLIFVGLIGLTLIPMQADFQKGEVVDFVVYLETPERQMLADEIIAAAEDCGLVVNAIYVDFNTWLEYAHGTWDYDLLFGPYMSVPKDMDIFFLTYFNYILYSVIPHDDKKWTTLLEELIGMYIEAMINPDIVDDEYINTMATILQKIEKRLWAKQFFSVFCHYEVPESFWGPIPTMETEALNYNCLKGRVFHDTDLRLALNEAIDKQVFLDYYEAYTSFEVYEIYDIFYNQPFSNPKIPFSNP